MIAVFENKQQILLEEEETPKTPNLTWTNHSISAPEGGAAVVPRRDFHSPGPPTTGTFFYRKELQEALAIHCRRMV
jgi:hypothetical protein